MRFAIIMFMLLDQILPLMRIYFIFVNKLLKDLCGLLIVINDQV